MKILITGAKGMLAKAVIERFKDGNTLILTDVDDLDITNYGAVEKFILSKKPDLIINCAGYTAVDNAEDQIDLADKINGAGPANLAKAANLIGATLVHISTDYVFKGNKALDSVYYEDDITEPITAYGITKLHGEEKALSNNDKTYIFRTAWLYGDGNNFVRTMLKLAKDKDKLTVVCDQHGSPTYSEDLAQIIYEAIEKNIPYGVYHATNMGYTTWDEFARKIFENAGIDIEVISVSSDEFKTKAKRPLNSMLSKDKLLLNGIEVPYWKQGLENYMKKEGTYKKDEQ